MKPQVTTGHIVELAWHKNVHLWAAMHYKSNWGCFCCSRQVLKIGMILIKCSCFQSVGISNWCCIHWWSPELSLGEWKGGKTGAGWSCCPCQLDCPVQVGRTCPCQPDCQVLVGGLYLEIRSCRWISGISPESRKLWLDDPGNTHRVKVFSQDMGRSSSKYSQIYPVPYLLPLPTWLWSELTMGQLTCAQ